MRFRIHTVVLLAALAACKDSTGTTIKTAAHLDLVSGANQLGGPGQPLAAPVVVRATDAAGKPVSGATVLWTASSGSVSAASTQTDTAGRASVSWTLSTGTVQVLAASVAGAPPVLVTAQGLPSVIHSCETNTATLCANWTWSNGRYVADWSDGSHANIVPTTFRADSVVFTRDDPSGTSVGMHAVYRGIPVSNSVNGTVTWTQGGFSFSGGWQASW